MSELKTYVIAGNQIKEVSNVKALTLASFLKGQELESDNPLNISMEELAKHYASNPFARRCVNIRSNMLSAIPWQIRYKDKVLKPFDSPVNILNTVNPETNYVDLMRATVSDMIIFGTAYWRICGVNYKEGTKPKFIMRMNPSTVRIVTDETGITHFVQTLGIKEATYERGEVVYFHGYHPLSDVTGLSSIASCISDIKTMHNASVYAAKFFENGAMPALLVSVTGASEMTQPTKKDISIIEHLWNQKNKGVKNAGKALFIGKNIQVEPLSLPIDKMALQDIKEEARRSICAAIEVPMTMAGASEAANRATSQEQRESLYHEVVFPQSSYMKGVIDAEYLSKFGTDMEFDFLIDELPFMQENRREQALTASILVQAGIRTPEQAAEELGYEKPKVKSIKPKTSKPKTIANDLKTWQRKCIKRVKAGKSPDCKFNSELISEGRVIAIRAQLKKAKTEEDVISVFIYGTYG